MHSLFNDFSYDIYNSSNSNTDTIANERNDETAKNKGVTKILSSKELKNVSLQSSDNGELTNTCIQSLDPKSEEIYYESSAQNIDDFNKTIFNSNFNKKLVSSSYSDKKSECCKNSSFLNNSALGTTFQNSNILNFRQRIDDETNDCFKFNLAERERLWLLVQNGEISSDVYKKRFDNLCIQQREFDNFINSLKEKVTISNFSRDTYLMKTVMNCIEKEAEIFKQFLPAYSFKKDVFDKIEKNQVTIINADSSYFFNIALPLFLYNDYLEHTTIVCESNEIMSHVLQNRLDSFFPNQRAEDKELFLRSLKVVSAEKLLVLISDPTFISENNFCIICNVPLKRSVGFDILLSGLRDLLANHKYYKLVLLLSKYDNFEKFNCYFSQKVICSSLKFHDLVLPVSVMWKDSVCVDSNFMENILDTIISIHALKKSGDIITFLPSVSVAASIFEKLERELHNYQFSDLVLICIINESSLRDYLMKKDNISSKRKVYLTLDDNEGIAIPFIKYVIDCGKQKEYLFDIKNLYINASKSCYISRARAKLRKELAGLYDIGVCYRIYCKNDYKKMHPKEHPEIFCINPVHTFVKYLEHRSDTSEKFQFVESLPLGIQDATLELLKNYGAIDETLHLTSIGTNLIKLPYPTPYSRFILLATQYGFAYEAIVIISFFLVETTIFLESDDAGVQRSIDAAKLNFSTLDSDSFTYLNLFKAWKENNFRKVWCNKNHINHEALRSIRLKVNEIWHMVQDCLGENIKDDFTMDNDPNLLVELLHLSFQDNLCVFTGHPRIGYQILSSHELALVHPSSFLFSREILPRFVIYDKLIREKQIFISNLTCISSELLLKFIEEGTSKFAKSQCFDEILCMEIIEPIGEKVISQVLLKNNGRRIRELEETIKKNVNAKVVVIEPILGKGCVHVYALPKDIFNCCAVLKEMLQNQAQALVNEKEIKLIELKKGQNAIHVEVVWIKGALTESFKHIFLDLPTHTNQLTQHNIENFAESIQSSAIKYSLKLSWPRRICTGEGFLSLNKRQDFGKARKLAHRFIKVAENEIYLEINRFKENQLIISHIAPDITKDDLNDTFTHLLPECEFKVELCSAPFETTSDELQNIKKQIEEICNDQTNIDNYDVQVLMPEPSSGFMEAIINIHEERSLDIEAKNVSMAKLNEMKILCKPFYFSTIKCSTSIYKALKNSITDKLFRFRNELKQYKAKSYFQVKPVNDTAGEDMNIDLSSNDLEVMKALQRMINLLLDGVKLDKCNTTFINKLFCHGGHLFLKAVGKSKDVYILENFETKTIRLYGSPENCEHVNQCISNFLADTENEVAKTIILEKQNRMILKEIINTFGVNLESLIELFGLRSAALNIKSCSLMLCGKKDNVQKAENSVKELSQKINPSLIGSDSESEEICPLCGCPAENLTFRLEFCAHLYCSLCIENLVEQATLPLQRIECSSDIVLSDIRHVLNEDERKIQDLLDKSMKNYLERKHTEIFHCPAADCPFYIYKSEVTESRWNCPLCKNSICVNCNIVFHEGLSCDMYKGSKEDPDYSLKVWRNNNVGVSMDCPFCRTLIEKSEGCNHMTCRICSRHFCWLCGKGYETGPEVYRHINTSHMGMLFA